MELFGFVLAFIIGVIMGLIGAGGSILTSGVMIYIFGLNPVISASYTLLNVGVISLIGSVQYYRKELVDVNTGLFFSIPAIAIVLAMRFYIVPAIPAIIFQYEQLVFTKELLIMLVFAILMIVIGCNMISNGKAHRKPKQTETNKPLIILIGIGVGMLTGFVGVGGGFIIVPALFFFTSLDMKKAIGTSLFIITLNTAIGFLTDFSSGIDYNWIFLLKLIFVTVSGMLVSGLVISRIKTDNLKKVFAIAMFIFGCWIIVKELMIQNI
jgi:uncharacterized membrane protein YfcA